MRQTPSLLKLSSSENSGLDKPLVDSTGTDPSPIEQNVGVLSDTNRKALRNNTGSDGESDLLSCGQGPSSYVDLGSTAEMLASTPDKSHVVNSTITLNTDGVGSGPPTEVVGLTLPGSSVSEVSEVTFPTMERSSQWRNHKYKFHASARQSRSIPHGSIGHDASMMLTLDEDEELTVSSSDLPEDMLQPQLLRGVSPSMMGRRHSVDSNIGRSRPPTFVRTYREVKWKRVGKPSKLQPLPRTCSTDNLPAAAGIEDDEAESREYISGTHIIRQRVPIFMTSAEPPDPMGRRFSAGDLIPVSGPGRNWAPNGKCLVIRDRVPSKLTLSSDNDDSSSSSSSPASSSEDVSFFLSSDGSRHSSAEDDDHLQFSLIDEDDEDDLTEEETEDEEEDNEQKRMHSELTVSEPTSGAVSNSSSASFKSLAGQGSASTQKKNVLKHFDLRRMALENLQQQKATLVSPSSPTDMEPGHQTPSVSPTTPGVVQQAMLPATTPPFMLPIMSDSGVVSAGTELQVMPSAPHLVLASASAQLSTLSTILQPVVTPSTAQPGVVSIAAQSTFLQTTAQTGMAPAESQTCVTRGPSQQTLATTAAPSVTASTTAPLSAVKSITDSMSVSTVAQPTLVADTSRLMSTRAQPFVTPSTTETASELKTAHSSNAEQGVHDTVTYERVSGSAVMNPELSLAPDPSHVSVSGTDVPRPPTPSEMPWVMTSTKIGNANVYVSSSRSPDSHTSIRSAHWISPRCVEGTIPINLDNARAIRVETVSVPTSPGNKPLQFQKVSYSSGLIISSAQWVAPIEVLKEPSTASEKSNPLPSVTSVDRQPALCHAATTSPPTNPDVAPCVQSTLSPKKLRRKYVEKTGVTRRPILGTSDLSSVGSLTSSARRSRNKILTVTAADDQLNGRETDRSVQPHTNGTLLRKPKRRFDVENVQCDQLNLHDLCAQLMLSSSPTSSKRRFIVENVSHQLCSSQLSDISSMSTTICINSHPRQSTWDFVVKEVLDKPLEKAEEKIDSGWQLSSPSEQDDSASPEFDKREAVPSHTTSSHVDVAKSVPSVNSSQVHVAKTGPLSPTSSQVHVAKTVPPSPTSRQVHVAKTVPLSPTSSQVHVAKTVPLSPTSSQVHVAKTVPPSTTSTHVDQVHYEDTQPADHQSNCPDMCSPEPGPAAHNETAEPAASTSLSELTAQLIESVASIDLSEKPASPGKRTTVRTDTEDDEKFMKENDALMQMVLKSISETNEDVSSNSKKCGGSTVAIDNKIEQAMDLVKRHLMYAVREEVEILKQQIGEMMDRIGQLEYENTVLRSEAKPETLNKLQQPRLTQPPQAALSSQPQAASITVAPTPQQPAASQIQLPQQTPMPQGAQQPSTT